MRAFGQFNLYQELQIEAQTEKITCLQISDDGRFLAYGDHEGGVCLWDLNAKRELHSLHFHDRQVNGILFDSKNRYLVSASDDNKIAVWDLYSGQAEKILEDFKSKIKVIDLSPDDQILAACGDKSEIFMWEFPLGSFKGRLKGHEDDVVSLSFNPNGDQILSLDKDKKMILWDVGRQQPVRNTEIASRTMKNSGIDVVSANFSPDKYFIAVGLQEHVLAKGGNSMIFKYNLGFYDWKTGSEIEILEGNNKDIRFFSISPDKNYAITDNSTLRQNQISFWNIPKGIVEQNYPIKGEVTAITVSKNGMWLAVAYVDAGKRLQCGIHVWRLSGIDGYQRFNSGQEVKSSRTTGFGSAMKLTTPKEPLIQYGERKRVAVMYFDSPGLSEDIAKTTSYLLEGRLGNSSFVELIERNQINSVISELKYQMSGLTASDAVEIGKHLNAKYIVIGSINKLGNLLIITAKLVNIETSQIEGTREVQCNNATIEDISEMVALLAPSIAK
jgi:WD40 repeat protein/TolB-like protein